MLRTWLVWRPRSNP